MNIQLKNILAVLCVTTAGTVMAATPTSPAQPPIPHLLVLSTVADGTITGLEVTPAEIFDNEAFTPWVSGTGKCAYQLKIDDEVFKPSVNVPQLPNGKLSGAKSFLPLPTGVNEHVFKVTVIPVAPCTSSAGATLTGNIKVKRVPSVPINTGTPTIAPVSISVTPVIATIPFTASCPAPYFYHTDGSDGGKGEYYCKKAEPTCPTGWAGSVDKATGTLTCTSIPQPTIPCQKSTPTWKWGAIYYKEGWDKMGCKAGIQAVN